MEYVYTKIDRGDFRSKLKEVSKRTINNSFGVSFIIKNRELSVYTISPHSAGIRGEIEAPIELGAFESHDAGLLNPSFFTLSTTRTQGLDYYLANLSKFCLPNERIVVQLIVKKMPGTLWREELLDMYTSYLRGNDNPFSLSMGRRLQEGVIELLGSLGNFENSKEYISEVEDKILDTGYEFKMVVGVMSKEPHDIIQRIKDALSKYNSYNSIGLYKTRTHDSKNILEIKKNIITRRPTKNILSERELFTLLSGSEKEVIKEVLSTSQNMGTKRQEFDFLPRHPRPQKSMNEIDKITLISQLSESLKRVGIISTARLYDSDVAEGIRLILVQFAIPKGKSLTHIEKKSRDIQAALGVRSLSVEQGDRADTVKIILPNDSPSVVGLREIVELDSFSKFSRKESLPFIVGVDEIGDPIYLSLSKLIHLLVAGTTGSGKSVFINSLLTTLLATHAPEELQMVMIDPKMVELQQYKGMPHVRDVITDMSQAEIALSGLVDEMETRYKELQRIGVKNIDLYNQSDKKDKIMPRLVCVIDEYADLKDSNSDVEKYIGRLGQKARASGIHMVIATQRPSKEVISGRIKSVIPNAISFNLNNNTDYKTVFGTGIGNVTLLGRGDGIMKIEGYKKHLQRFQSCMVSVDEMEEERVYKRLAEKVGGFKREESEVRMIEMESETKEPSQLEELKRLIATTSETRMSHLRSKMGIRMESLGELVKELVNEGWLTRYEQRNKGYELTASKEELDRWKG